MLRPNPNTFANNPLDRAGVARKDPAYVTAAWADDRTRVLSVHDRGPAVADDGALDWQPCDGAMPDEAVLLGLLDGAPRFAVRGEADEDARSLRSLAGDLSAEEAAIAGEAVWLLRWHESLKFCPRHGGPTVMADGGFKRIHKDTGTEHFPRIDPVVIALPILGDRVCLGRSPRFPENLFSALAGYVEACETLEECVAREIHEEVGLSVTQTEYIFSQPWPFPSSLMIGFFAPVTDDRTTLDEDEIAEISWFTRDEIRVLIDGEEDREGRRIPPPFTIAHQLLKLWALAGSAANTPSSLRSVEK